MNNTRCIQVCHMSDLHYSGKNLAESEACFGHAVARAIEVGADCVVVSGDSTDHALDAHSPAFVALVRNIRRLADHCPVLMLQGTYSHEPPGTLSVFKLLGGRFPVYVADSIRQVALLEGGEWVESEGWRFDRLPDGARIVFSCIPTVNKAAVAGAVGATAAAEAVGEHISALLAGLAPINRSAREAGIASVVVSHGTVSGCTTEHGVPMAGLDHEFTVGSLFAAEASATMLGHIHRHQGWEQDGRTIAYAGSIGRFHYGEEGDKGMLVWSVGPDRSNVELDMTPARRTIEVRFAGAPDIEELRGIAEDANGAFVKVAWEVPEEERTTVDRAAIEAALAGAAEIKLEGRIIPMVRSRAHGISRAQSLAEKLQRWAEVTDVDAAPLCDALADLAARTPEAIAAEILGIHGEEDRQTGRSAESVSQSASGGNASEREELDLFA